jgi:hypothetical protein
MSFFTIILLLIQYGPAIIQIAKQIWDLIQLRKDKEERAQLKVELKAAAQIYKRDRDIRPLERLHTRLRLQSFGSKP